MSRFARARSLGGFASFVSPFAVRVWFTVAAAIRSAVSSGRPRFSRFDLMWSYCRSRLSLQACCGMAVTSSTRACKRRARSPAEAFCVDTNEIGDSVDGQVRRRSRLRFRRVVALTDVDRRGPRSEAGLRAGKQGCLVVDMDVVACRKTALHFGQVVLLVFVDQNVAARGEQQTRAGDLRRLIDAVAIRQDRDVTESPELFDDRHRARI